MRLTKRQLITAALVNAVDWQESIADGWHKDAVEYTTAKERARQYRSILQSRGYTEPVITGVTVSVSDISSAAQSPPPDPVKEYRVMTDSGPWGCADEANARWFLADALPSTHSHIQSRTGPDAPWKYEKE